jgi:hypothetical protein
MLLFYVSYLLACCEMVCGYLVCFYYLTTNLPKDLMNMFK